MKRRLLFGVLGLGMLLPASAAEPLAYAAYQAFVRQLYAQWYLPRSGEFAVQAERLVIATSVCGDGAPIQGARNQWLETVSDWEYFSVVRGGALFARRSPRDIDFMPTRPDAIQRAVATDPQTLGALDEIGSPAKGLPALEWLLWRQSDPTKAHCSYQALVARAVAAEAGLLVHAYEKALGDGWDESAAEYAMYEFLNLWASGLQKLWWEDMERPLQKSVGRNGAAWSRAASGHTRDGWLRQWAGLRRLAVGPAPSIQQYLLTQGQAKAADRLQQEVTASDTALAALGPALDTPDGRRQIQAAIKSLQGLQSFAEGEMAAALQFVISFFDEDGD